MPYKLVIRSSKPKIFKFSSPDKALFYAFYFRDVLKAKKVKIQLS